MPRRRRPAAIAFAAVKKQTVEERRTEILEVTCDVVIERGFAGTRISDVAKRLEVSSSLIHYHFDSKEQLLAEAFAHYARKDLAEMEAEIESAPTALAQLDRTIHSYVPEGSDDVEWKLWIDGWGEALRNPMMKKISQELDEQSAGLLERVIDAGVERGEFRCAEPHAAAMRLAALVDGLAVQFAAHDGMMDRSQLIEHVRVVAAAEVGLPPGAFESAEELTSPAGFGEPSASTDSALRHLVARQCDGVVRANTAVWTSTWADDAVWDRGTGKPVNGRGAIAAAWERDRQGYDWVVQSPLVTVFEVDEHTGRGTGRVVVSERSKRTAGKAATMLGTFHDRYVRVDGQWMFAERRLEVIERT